MSFGRPDRAYIIAEAGVNHNGSIEMARQLVHVAKTAGADAVKFQTFRAERVAQANAPKADYQLRNTDGAESQIEMLRKLELPAEAHAELYAWCQELGIDFLSTPYNEEDIDLLAELGVKAFKLASIHLVEPHLLRYAAATGRHIIVSTGMATMLEVTKAVETLRGAGADFTLLQCTTNYPSRVEDANLRAMVTMGETLQCRVGYSDHTQSDVSCIAAVALGACMIEKHLTLDQTLPGPDHSSAASPEEMERLVTAIRAAEAALGHGRKEPSAAEAANSRNMRRSLVARCDLRAGDRLTVDAVTCRRPATGISPMEVDEVIRRTAAVDIPAGTQIEWSMLC